MEGKELFENFMQIAEKSYSECRKTISWKTLDYLDKKIWNELATKLELKKV